MKKLLALCLLLAMNASAATMVNITNYPTRTTFDQDYWFLLSSVGERTNYNLPGNYVASTAQLNAASNALQSAVSGVTNAYPWTNLTVAHAGGVTNGYGWTNLTVDHAGAVTNGYPWTNVVVAQATHATNADLAAKADVVAQEADMFLGVTADYKFTVTSLAPGLIGAQYGSDNLTNWATWTTNILGAIKAVRADVVSEPADTLLGVTADYRFTVTSLEAAITNSIGETLWKNISGNAATATTAVTATNAPDGYAVASTNWVGDNFLNAANTVNLLGDTTQFSYTTNAVTNITQHIKSGAVTTNLVTVGTNYVDRIEGTNSSSLTIACAGTELTLTSGTVSAPGAGGFSGYGGNLTELSASQLTTGTMPGARLGYSVPAVTDSGTNWVVNPALGMYQRIAATNNISFVCFTNGPGAVSIKIRPNGADRVLWWPTNWVPLYTNGLTLSGATWMLTLTNAVGTTGPRAALFSAVADGTDPTNVIWGVQVSP